MKGMHLLTAMMGMAAASGYAMAIPEMKGPKSPQYPFNKEELEKLAAFDDIKAKKKYLKTLKLKYHGHLTNTLFVK